jgi:hypothetical protein
VAVRAEHAFAAPEVLAQFVQEMRGKAEELRATAVLLIAPKAAVQFPQVCDLTDMSCVDWCAEGAACQQRSQCGTRLTRCLLVVLQTATPSWHSSDT